MGVVTSGEPLVKVDGLQYRYEDGTIALQGVDFQLFPEETVALFGANGSGKTTFALHLNGLLRGQGRIEVCGLLLNDKHLADIRRRIGFVFQHPDEQLFMPTVLEDVAFGPLNFGVPERDAHQVARTALAQVEMAHAAGKAPYHLSAGEKRRVALAGVLATNPQLLVLDEPTTYLDPPGVRSLVRLLRRISTAKILITHDIPFARALADRAVFFQKGKILAEGSVDRIVTDYRWDLDDLTGIDH